MERRKFIKCMLAALPILGGLAVSAAEAAPKRKRRRVLPNVPRPLRDNLGKNGQKISDTEQE